MPIKTYSVVRISLALFNSPKRKTDFAASKKPTPSKLPARTNVRIMILSIYPIHCPALGKLCVLEDTGVHFLRNNPNKIEDGLNINIYATTVNQTFAEQWFSIYERTEPPPYKTNHNTPIIIVTL